MDEKGKYSHNPSIEVSIKILFLILLLYWSKDLFFPEPFVSRTLLNYPNLMIHEGGHIIFMIFTFLGFLGRFLIILGGSLTECAVPFGVALYFFYQRAWYSFGFCLYWFASALIDMSIYIGDAQSRVLPLLNIFGGSSYETHDWFNILSMVRLLSYDHIISAVVFYIGIVSLILGIIVMAVDILSTLYQVILQK